MQPNDLTTFRLLSLKAYSYPTNHRPNRLPITRHNCCKITQISSHSRYTYIGDNFLWHWDRAIISIIIHFPLPFRHESIRRPTFCGFVFDTDSVPTAILCKSMLFVHVKISKTIKRIVCCCLPVPNYLLSPLSSSWGNYDLRHFLLLLRICGSLPRLFSFVGCLCYFSHSFTVIHTLRARRSSGKPSLDLHLNNAWRKKLCTKTPPKGHTWMKSNAFSKYFTWITLWFRYLFSRDLVPSLNPTYHTSN